MTSKQYTCWREGFQVAQVSDILHVAEESLDMICCDTLVGQAVQQVTCCLLQQMAYCVIEVPAVQSKGLQFHIQTIDDLKHSSTTTCNVFTSHLPT